MTWQLHVPHCDRSDSLVEVGGFARHLEGEDRPVARELAMYAVRELSMNTAGELLDHLEASGPEQRRAVLDRARAGAGLEPIEAVEARERVKAAQQRSSGGGRSGWQLCGEPTCNAVPLNELGAPTAVDVRRWWCAEHRHLARPGDMEPHGPGVRISESGALVPVDEAEEARDAAKAESRQAVLAARLADCEADAAAVRLHREARAEETRRLLPPGVPG